MGGITGTWTSFSREEMEPIETTGRLGGAGLPCDFHCHALLHHPLIPSTNHPVLLHGIHFGRWRTTHSIATSNSPFTINCHEFIAMATNSFRLQRVSGVWEDGSYFTAAQRFLKNTQAFVYTITHGTSLCNCNCGRYILSVYNAYVFVENGFTRFSLNHLHPALPQNPISSGQPAC